MLKKIMIAMVVGVLVSAAAAFMLGCSSGEQNIDGSWDVTMTWEGGDCNQTEDAKRVFSIATRDPYTYIVSEDPTENFSFATVEDGMVRTTGATASTLDGIEALAIVEYIFHFDGDEVVGEGLLSFTWGEVSCMQKFSMEGERR